MRKIAKFVKQQRKSLKITQEDFALKTGVGLRFLRELEQGKETLRMDKVNQVLQMFGYEAGPTKIEID
ncbi:MAG: helix-turn-helix transcriptional regulator [Candidatus Caenarcaniphilales bacterium]|nr:helix-turn-helix transcriptional regulator [Candidatus Caenarcaniphilales bacterium]